MDIVTLSRIPSRHIVEMLDNYNTVVVCLRHDCIFSFNMVSLVITFMDYPRYVNYIINIYNGNRTSRLSILSIQNFSKHDIHKMPYYLDGSRIFLLPSSPFYTCFFDKFIVNWYPSNGLENGYFNTKICELIQESNCNFIRLFSFQPLWKWRGRRYFLYFLLFSNIFFLLILFRFIFFLWVFIMLKYFWRWRIMDLFR